MPDATKENTGLSSLRQSKTTWVLTEAAFTKLLSAFDPDPERAGEKYEALRESLVKFLDWRGARAPEDLVDETFNRVARKLEEGEAIQDVPSYCHGVARLVFLQSLEHPSSRTVELDAALPIAAPEPKPEARDARRECLTHSAGEPNQRPRLRRRGAAQAILSYPGHVIANQRPRLRRRGAACRNACRGRLRPRPLRPNHKRRTGRDRPLLFPRAIKFPPQKNPRHVFADSRSRS
jgi:DNA-directed RNA polymerase specialized sigma24 family protein